MMHLCITQCTYWTPLPMLVTGTQLCNVTFCLGHRLPSCTPRPVARISLLLGALWLEMGDENFNFKSFIRSPYFFPSLCHLHVGYRADRAVDRYHQVNTTWIN